MMSENIYTTSKKKMLYWHQNSDDEIFTHSTIHGIGLNSSIRMNATALLASNDASGS